MKKAIWIVAAVAFAWIALNFFPGAPICGRILQPARRMTLKKRPAAQRSSAPIYTLVHRPKASPEGCSHDYSFQLSRQSALLMWCKSPDGTSNVASHATTYHLRYVDVPEQINLEKRAGEPVTIELQKTAGKPKVLRAY